MLFRFIEQGRSVQKFIACDFSVACAKFILRELKPGWGSFRRAILAKFLMTLAVVFVCDRIASAQTSSLPVFPGAVGFGTTTVAGSGRGTNPPQAQIIKVTNLNDTGTGSLRACMTATGPRTCVFEVAGYINLATKITIKSPNLSVFGQTAPYPGIQVRDGSIVVQADDVLIQHIASRPGDRNLPTDGGTGVKAGDRDGLGVWGISSSDPVERVVFDHVSVTWGMDESISTYTGANSTADGTTPIRNFTISNSLIAEGLNNSNHGDTEGKHSMFSLLGSNTKNMTYYRNLVANSNGRHIRMKSNSDVEFVNNYVYNFANTSTNGYNQWNMDYSSGGTGNRINFMNNVYQRGPTTADTSSPVFFYSSLTPTASRVYVSHNISSNTRPIDSGSEWLIANANGKGLPSSMQATSPAFALSSAAANLLPPTQLLGSLVSSVGARPWNRYPHDTRIINETVNNTGKHKDCTTTATCCVTNTGGTGYCPVPGKILIDGSTKNTSSPVNAWSAIPAATRPLAIPANPMSLAANGYTNLENYIFSFASDTGPGSSTPTPVPSTATPLSTPTSTATYTFTPAPPTATFTATATSTYTMTSTPTFTTTYTATPTFTYTSSATPTVTATFTATPTSTSTWTMTSTPTGTASSTPISATPTQIATPTSSGTGTPTAGTLYSVIKVTSLADTGDGTLRDCVQQPVPRVCVFEVSGRLKLSSDLIVTEPDLIVAGQTAPSPGVMITNGGFNIQVNKVRIEHLVIRPGDEASGTSPSQRRAITVSDGFADDIRLKNLSLSWGVDSNVTTIGAVDRVLLKDSIIAEALWRSIHPLGSRGNGVLVGETAEDVIFQGNLIAANNDRNIRWKYNTTGEMINNVIFGWGGTSSWNTTNLSDLDNIDVPTKLDVIGNVYVPGPQGLKTAYAVYSENMPTGSKVYLVDNIAPYLTNIGSSYRSSTRLWSGPAPIAGKDTEASVYARAGARPWDRNADDLRIIAGAKARTLRLRDTVGTWPTYAQNRRSVIINTDPISEQDLDAALLAFEK